MPNTESEVRILLSLGSHGKDGQSSLEEVFQSARDFFIPEPGQNIFFTEGANVPESRATRMPSLYATWGSYTDAYLAEMVIHSLNRPPSKQEIEILGRKARRDKPGFAFLQCAMLDRLATERNFILESEYYPDDLLEEMESKRAKVKQSQATYIGQITDGNINRAISMFREHSEMDLQLHMTRNQYTATRVTALAQQALTDGEQLRLFLRFGTLHTPMEGILRQQLDGIESLEISTKREDAPLTVPNYLSWIEAYHEDPNFEPTRELVLKCILEDVITSLLLHSGYSEREIQRRETPVLEGADVTSIEEIFNSMKGKSPRDLVRLIIKMTSSQ